MTSIMLCEKCKVIELDDQLPGLKEITLADGQVVLDYEDKDLELEYDRRDTFPDLPGLESSAKEGCGFCSFLRTTIQEQLADQWTLLCRNHLPNDSKINLRNLAYEWDDNTYQDPPDHYVDESRRWEGITALTLKVSNDDESLCCYPSFDVVGAEGQFSTNYLRIHRRPISETLSETNTLAMRSFMDDCLRHTECTRDTFTPTRLVDIGSDDQPVRIIVTSEDDRFRDNDESSCYLALSYCWGPSNALRPPLTTEKRSLKARMRRIRMEAVPRTIADAFIVTRALGYQFIWVDSLCILQDDKDDWESESACMRRIYGSAAATVVAASSRTSHDGFLKRFEAELLTVPYHPTRYSNQDGHFYIQRGHSQRLGSEYERNTEFVEWGKRAWTLQENLASQCLLYFGPTVSFYRCQKYLRAENTQAQYRPSDFGTCWSYELQTSNVMRTWYRMVEEYSGRKLTFPMDKMPAISALADDMERIIHSEYLAGLWLSDLVWGLLWHSIDSGMNAKTNTYYDIRSDVYRAPSWSWAAGDGVVEWYGRDKPRSFQENVIITGANTSVSGQDPHGCVADGSITVYGRVRHVSVLKLSSSGGYTGSLNPYNLVLEDKIVLESLLTLDWSSPPNVLASIQEEGVWILLLASYSDSGWDFQADKMTGDSTWTSAGLVLSSVPSENSPRTFRRVGYFRIFNGISAEVFQNTRKEEIILV